MKNASDLVFYDKNRGVDLIIDNCFGPQFVVPRTDGNRGKTLPSLVSRPAADTTGDCRRFYGSGTPCAGTLRTRPSSFVLPRIRSYLRFIAINLFMHRGSKLFSSSEDTEMYDWRNSGIWIGCYFPSTLE